MSADTRIVVGMSGGVDSSVTAARLLDLGYQVEGLFMKNWEEEDTDTFCHAERDVQDAKTVCEQLGIPLHTVNFAAEYWEHVFEHFLQEYQAGRTPNPDILCNREIKFKVFLEHAMHMGATRIATGHYARIRRADGRLQLLKGVDPHKDQSYFLHALNQSQLQHACFPIGELDKTETRRIALSRKLATAQKKDSTGICFIGEQKFKAFLNRYLSHAEGVMVSETGHVIGQHDGLMFYTIGQRKGLKIGGRKAGLGAPWYVADKRVESNELVVVQGSQHPALFKSKIRFSQMHWIGETCQMPLSCKAKIRYRQVEQACTVQPMESGRFEAIFEAPQRAVTPGQSIVFYDGEVCLGGGIID